MTHFYLAYGWLLESELELPGFHGAAAGEPDVRIRLGKLPTFRHELGLKARSWSVASGEVTIRVEKLGTFSLGSGAEVIVDPDPDVDEWDLVAFLKKPVLTSLLVIRRRFPLQASAVDTPLGAIVRAGATGAGKSTLAAALHS